MGLEVEDKFRVHPEFVLPELLVPDGVVSRVAEPREALLEATYYDSSDLRLARQGITLRFRTGDEDEGWQLKVPVFGAPPGVRRELHEAGSDTAPPEGLLRLLRAQLRGAPVEPRATLRTRRTTYDLLDADGRVLAEVVDDRVDAHTADRHTVEFREIEVEDRGGGSQVLDAVGRLLIRSGAVRGEFEPKVARALGLQATAPADPPAPQPVAAGSPARTLVTSVLRRHVRALLAHDIELRLQEADALHQVRVSCRRLRAVLRELAPLLDPVWREHIEEELRWVGRELGAGRDAEIVEERVRAQVEAGNVDRVAGERLLASLTRRAAAAMDSAAEVLDSERYLRLLVELVDAATHPRTTDLADRPCSAVAPGLFTSSWRRLARRARRAIASSDDELLHPVRIAAKRTRYLTEALEEVYGEPAGQLARRLRRLQDVLGEHQDALTAARVLADAGMAPRIGKAAFTYGVLHEQQRCAARRAREEFLQIWPRTARRKLRSWANA